MSAEDVLRAAVLDLLERAADAWARGAPVLGERFYDAATVLLGDVALEPTQGAR